MSYRIIYQVNEERKEVYIITVFDNRQDPDKLLEVLKKTDF